MKKMLVLSLAFVLGLSFATPLAAGNGASKELPFYGSFTGWVFPFETNPESIATRCTDNPEGKAAWAIASFEGWVTLPIWGVPTFTPSTVRTRH